MGDGPGFLIGWLRAISYAIATSAVALGFASYLSSLLHLPTDPVLLLVLATALITIVTLLDYRGLRIVARTEKYLVLITVAGLLIFILSAIRYGSWTPDRFTPPLPFGPTSIITAASLAFFAYSGFNTVATLTPEVKDGPVNVPKAILISLVVSTFLYILVVLWDARTHAMDRVYPCGKSPPECTGLLECPSRNQYHGERGGNRCNRFCDDVPHYRRLPDTPPDE